MMFSLLVVFSVAVLAFADGPVEKVKEKHNNATGAGGSLRKFNDPGSRIVGGVDARPDEFPWFVSWSVCGASLIHPQVILSAAHCDAAIAQDTVYVNSYRIFPNQDGERRVLTERISHEDFNAITYDYDFMVGKLDAPVDDVPTLPLNPDGKIPIPGQDLIVMGHGTPFLGGNLSDVLMKVTVNYIPTIQCNMAYAGALDGRVMMCAGVSEGGKDACEGDSGGPLIACNAEEKDCEQVGIVSFGIGCGEKRYPGVYSRVSGVIGWIQEKVCELTVDQANQPSYCDNSIQPTLAPAPSTPAPVPTPPLEGQLTVRVELVLDQFPSETTWFLLEGEGEQELIQKGGPYAIEDSVLLLSWNLDIGRVYRFEVYDSYGDGLCCEFGRGGYVGYIEYSDGSASEIFRSNGQFTFESINEFRVENATPAPTPSTPPNPGFPPCNVCGGNQRITIPDGAVDIPTQGPLTCADVQQAGDLGFIDPVFCPGLPAFLTNCGCEITVSSRPSPSPTAEPTPAPTPVLTPEPTQVPTPAPPTVYPRCNICGRGTERVTVPEGIIFVRKLGKKTCGELQLAGDAGRIKPKLCRKVRKNVDNCGCSEIGNTYAPSPIATAFPSSPAAAPNCGDSDGVFFVDENNGYQNCGFLKSRPRFNFLCQFFEVAVICKDTCGVCEYFTG